MGCIVSSDADAGDSFFLFDCSDFLKMLVKNGSAQRMIGAHGGDEVK
jgi:hypothetical protein